MLNEQEWKGFIEALCYYLGKENAVRELRIVQIAEMSFEHLESDFGIDYFSLVLKISPIEYVEYSQDIVQIQNNLTTACKFLLNNLKDASLSSVVITPKYGGSIRKQYIPREVKVEVSEKLEEIRAMLISVSTGGPRINIKNDDYIKLRNDVVEIFSKYGIGECNLYTDLWQWHGVWSSGKYPSYQSRREWIGIYIDQFLDVVKKMGEMELPEVEISGTERIDRAVREIRFRCQRRF